MTRIDINRLDIGTYCHNLFLLLQTSFTLFISSSVYAAAILKFPHCRIIKIIHSYQTFSMMLFVKIAKGSENAAGGTLIHQTVFHSFIL